MSLAKRVLLALIAGLIAALSATALHVALAALDEDGGSADLTETLNLRPGDNLVGWVAETKLVAQIFEEIPQAQLIYRWDADAGAYRFATRDGGGNLEALHPGMAAKIRISGNRTVKWERALSPAKGAVTLYSGINWVAWSGRDGWPLDQVARGIGRSLVNIEVRGQVYQPGSDVSDVVGPLMGESTIRRGDALRVTVNRDLRWLQPTGMLPNIFWVGEISQSLREEITADVQQVVDIFAEEFAVETDFSFTTVLIYSGIDAAVEHAASGAEPKLAATPDILRSRLTYGGMAATRPWGFYVPVCYWQAPCPRPGVGHKIQTVAHELFHHLQKQLEDRWPSRSPVWLLEGTAMWLEWQLPAGLRQHPYEKERDWSLGATARATATLPTLERTFTSLPYRMGPLAAEQLAERSGTDAHVEYSRLLYPQTVGAKRIWVREPTWKEAFEAAYGLAAAEFYSEFAAWRDELPTPRERYNYDPNDVTLSGTLRHLDGSPASGFRVGATADAIRFEDVFARIAVVDDEGSFSIELAPETTQRLSVTRDGCTLWLTDDGLTTTRPQPGQHRDLDTRNLPELNLTLPEGSCENELRVKVLSLRGDDRPVEFNLVSGDGQTWIRLVRERSGTYSGFAPEAGQYRVRAHIDGCNLWYHDDGLVASWGDAQQPELGAEPVLIEFRISDDLCVRSVSGRLFDEDGAGVEGVNLWMATGDIAGFRSTAADGSFTITVPDAGDYALNFWSAAGGCRIYYSSQDATTDSRSATPITVADQDVTEIEFVVPDDPSSLCN